MTHPTTIPAMAPDEREEFEGEEVEELPDTVDEVEEAPVATDEGELPPDVADEVEDAATVEAQESSVQVAGRIEGDTEVNDGS